MSTFVLIHGAGDVGWYWNLVEAELRRRGHDAVAPALPCDDDAAGLPEYADAVVEAIEDRTDLVVVAQSLGGFTALRLGRSSGSMIPRSSHSPDDSTIPLAAPAVNSECAGHEQGTHNSLVGGSSPPAPQARARVNGRPSIGVVLHENRMCPAGPGLDTGWRKPGC
jgi:hypothetical protein